MNDYLFAHFRYDAAQIVVDGNAGVFNKNLVHQTMLFIEFVFILLPSEYIGGHVISFDIRRVAGSYMQNQILGKLHEISVLRDKISFAVDFKKHPDLVTVMDISSILPSFAVRSPFLAAISRPRLRSSMTDLDISPCVSTRAFLHSAMLAEVRLRNSLIDSTEISMD